jgi:hypothetical protein
VVASTVAVRLITPVVDESTFLPVLLGMRDPSLIDGHVQRPVDPIMIPLDVLGLARFDRCAHGRVAIDWLRFLAFARRVAMPRASSWMPRLSDDAHRFLPQRCQPIQVHPPRDAAGAFVLPRVDRMI